MYEVVNVVIGIDSLRPEKLSIKMTFKVSKVAKIRNRYNQVPCFTQIYCALKRADLDNTVFHAACKYMLIIGILLVD